jgi:peptide methionine sulfoxide reductase MsrA
VRVTYDEARVSYEDVLDAAFAASKPVRGSA